MTRKKYAGILRCLLIHVLRTTDKIPPDAIKRINKRIYRADYRIPESLKGSSYKGLYEELDKGYHMRIAGKA